jgi:hypothetical protein
MTEAIATEVADANQGNNAALDEFVSSLGLFEEDSSDSGSTTAESSTTAPRDEKGKFQPEDDLGDLDDDSKPWTAERAKEVKARLVAAREAAREATRKANAASARARAQEDRFTKTKTKVLELKEQVEARGTMVSAIERGLNSGDPKIVLETMGHLSKKDPLEFWTDISHLVASGKVAKSAVPPEVMSQLSEMRAELQRLAQAPVTQQQINTIEHLKDQLVASAASPEAAQVYPLVARFAASPDTRAEIREHLNAIKVDYYNQRGTTLDNGSAFGILEKRLKAHSELFQPVHASNAQATDVRGTASPALGEHTTARTEVVRQAPSPPPRATIPAALSDLTGGSRRLMSEQERVQEIARQTPASFFRDIGLGGMLLDGEE